MEVATVRAAQAGDRDALAAIVDEFMPVVLGAAYGLSGDWDIAGDVAQEVFATLVVRVGDLRDPAALPGWLMAVVRSSARRERRTLRVSAAENSAPDPGEVVVARDEARRVRLAVEALVPERRLPMVLHYFAGQSLQEIADLCGLPLSTVKQRMRAARRQLREGIDDMADEVEGRLRPDPSTDPSDVIRMYTAMRSGDLVRVGAILDDRPDLVDAREHWSRADSFAHRLPLTTGGGTPLLRAVERGDPAMVRLLLERGADPNGVCTCEGHERPLWVAVVQRETEIVEELLRWGANPDVAAFAGASALDVAQSRSYADIALLLRDAGATASLVAAMPRVVTSFRATGIKTIDLWCPFPDRGLVHLTPGFGLGAVVLVGELSYRAVKSSRPVVWTGFVQAPTDLGDIHHALAEGDVIDDVTLSMAPPGASAAEQIAAFEGGLRLAADDALLVVFAETGRLHAIDERLVQLAQRNGVTLIVAPLDGSVAPPRPEGSPYQASIVFDRERAKVGRWPAVGSASWSKVADAATADLANRARTEMTDALDAYLAQPFHVAEHVTGEPGESVSISDLHETVRRILDVADQAARDSLR